MKYKVKRSKTGLGLFAESNIEKGKFIIAYAGKMILNKEYDEYMKTHDNLYMFEVNKTYTIDGSARWNTARYINHSCDPNCEVRSYRNEIKIYAKMLILTGEELTIDYGSDYFNEHIKPKGCKCQKCQIKIKSTVLKNG